MSRLIDDDMTKASLTQDWFLELLLAKSSKEEMASALRAMVESVPTDYDIDKITHKIHCYFIEQIDNADSTEYCRLVNQNHQICKIVRSGGLEIEDKSKKQQIQQKIHFFCFAKSRYFLLMLKARHL